MNPRAAWDRLSGRNRRALSVGAAAAGLALLWTGAVAPWLDAVSERRSRLASQRDLLRAERDLLASADAYRAAVEAALGRLEAARQELLAGGSEGTAAAGLEQLVRDRAMAHRVLVAETAPRPSRDFGGGLTTVTLEVRGESDLEGVVGLLASLEGDPALLRVSDLALRRAAGSTGGSGALAFRLAVTGFRLSADGGGEAGASTAGGAPGHARDGAAGAVAARGGRP